MASDFGYRFTRKAESDLDEIVAYVAVELADPKAATDFIDRLKACIEEAMIFPDSGTLVDNEYLQFKNVRKKFVGNHIMYYLPSKKEKIVYVLRIVYGKRNIEELLSGLGFL